MRKLRRTTVLVALSVLLPTLAAAAVFPDVPDGHMYQEAIETLVHADVIKGNPDGRFYPDRDVNRAEMLKMLYKAKGQTPDPLSIRCFKDVEIGSWYEAYVCDAAARKYVNGYSDGTFRPGSPVNRVEALKMILTVFEIPVSEVSEEDRDLVKFVDVSTAAWYTKYLYAGFATGILPIAGQTGSRFYPEWPLKRGEAAAYIHNALNVDISQRRGAQSSSSRSSAESTMSSDIMSSTGRTQQSSKSIAAPTSIDTTFPFEQTGKFTGKATYSYKFSISEAGVLSIKAAPQSGQPGQITCRLYLVNETGFSDQYFLGYQDVKGCEVLAAVSPGSYQLQLQPTSADTTFSVTAKLGNGDGNDGFRQAKSLTVNAPKTENLGTSDLEDWFTFKVGSDQRMTVVLSNANELRCIVYAMNDVNLASFEGPQCNSIYTFPAGTYYIAIGRKAALGAQQTYTIKLEK